MPSNKTPASLGYRMPAEWEPHAATWLSWPRREGISFPESFDRILPALREMVAALINNGQSGSDSEPVCINVVNGAHEAEARAVLDVLPQQECITYYEIPTNEPWCRDHGPIFLTRDERWSRLAPEPEAEAQSKRAVWREGAPSLLAIVDWDYNAWGNKYPPFDLDEVVPTRIAEILKVPVFYPRMILEGGSIEVNGAGTLLTSESCLLNKNRNPNLSRGEIEQRLRDYLGVQEILWLGDGIEGDDTDGHIDDLARFVSETKVVTVVEENSDDANYGPLQENLGRLRKMKIGDRKIDIVILPMPKKIVREDLRLPASYANFYIANSCVLVPTFVDPADDLALSILRDCFPNRHVIGIDCRELIWGLGTFHCLTQQQPKT
ncbi:MAG: agmatine deiminase family protein [Verrucomicrobiota bacterium]|nr:agmatine deiminase family protein [Verrucomicrobiota bacterium]